MTLKTKILNRSRTLNKYLFVTGILVVVTCSLQAQDKWGEGEIEKVEIEIVKERQIILPKANRNFQKVP
jgi:hypothetical protein